MPKAMMSCVLFYQSKSEVKTRWSIISEDVVHYAH